MKYVGIRITFKNGDCNELEIPIFTLVILGVVLVFVVLYQIVK